MRTISKIKVLFYAIKHRKELKIISTFFSKSRTTSFGVEGFGLKSELGNTAYFFNVDSGIVTIYENQNRCTKRFWLGEESVEIDGWGPLEVPEKPKAVNRRKVLERSKAQ